MKHEWGLVTRVLPVDSIYVLGHLFPAAGAGDGDGEADASDEESMKSRPRFLGEEDGVLSFGSLRSLGETDGVLPSVSLGETGGVLSFGVWGFASCSGLPSG